LLPFIDRLLGRTEPVAAKAMTGPGAFAMTYHQPLRSFSADPHRLMAEAQGLIHSNGWVAAAERTLGGRFLRMDWHLENGDGETVDDTSPDEQQAVLRLLERPTTKTRAKLWGVTFRHLGLCGNAFWYLDQRDALAGTPLSIMYINPARMTPAVDGAGNVTGWILDHPDNQAVNARTSYQSRQGTPLSTEEVIHFTLDEPDWGIWGIGIAESAQRKIELDRLTDAHSGGVLASGGRLSGLVSPKAGAAVNDDQWVQFVRDWRSITSDPDAAKRLQVAKMPLDFTQMTASPKDLQLNEVTNLNRDTVFGLWGVPISERGFSVPAGLNSDVSAGYKETLWETVKERSEMIRESIQYELLDRWQALGINLQIIFDYPDFEDDSPKYEAATKSINVSLTNNERRAILGLDPLEDDELGNAIYVASTLTRIDVEPEPTIVQLPPEPDPVENTTEDEEEVVEGKAKLSLTGLRVKTEATFEPRIRKAVQAVLNAQKQLALSKVEHSVRKNDVGWWNDKRENSRFLTALEPLIAEMAADVAEGTRRKVKAPAKADTFLDSVLDAIRKSVAERVTGINATTRDAIKEVIKLGLSAGESPADIAARLQEATTFNEARAEMVSRTETMNAYNDAALRSYGELQVTEVEAIDGDEDSECAARHGQRYPIDEALGITDHPNGTLDWLPVLKADPDPMLVLAEAMKASLEREQPVPQVFMEAPVVHNHMPEQPAPQVTVNLPEQKATTKRVVRDDKGQITEVIEE
jgi:phage portal protein BeeE